MTGIRTRGADWADLRVFFAVAESGGVNAAARKLGVNPSTVTRAIEELESHLNVTLLHRGPKGITLTEAGQSAYHRVLTMSRMANALELEVRDAEANPEGRVRVAAPDGVAAYFVTPQAPAFLRAHPEIDLSFDCGLWSDHALTGEIDLTLTYKPPNHPDLVSRPVAHVHYGLFASREYISLYGAPQALDEMLRHPFIHHVAQAHQKEIWGERAAAFQVLLDKRFETNSSAAVIEAVRHGAGIGAMPTAILSVIPDLVMLDMPTLAPAQLWLAHHRDAARPARVRLVKEWLKSVFEPRTHPWFRPDFVHPRDFADAVGTAPPRPQGSTVAS